VRCERDAHQRSSAKRRAKERTHPEAAALLRVTRRSSEGASRPLLAAAGEAQAEARRTLHAKPSLPAIGPAAREPLKRPVT
jgi:hypothetical protein